MLTVKKNQTVKAIKKIKVGSDWVEAGTILVIYKGGKNPTFLTYLDGKEFGFSVNSSVLDKCFEDVVAENKVETELQRISFKKIKIFETMDGYAFSADLCINGKKIAVLENGGFGGPTDLHLYNKKDEDILNAAIDDLKKVRGEKIYDHEDNAGLVESFMNYLEAKENFFISFKEKMESNRKEWADFQEKYKK